MSIVLPVSAQTVPVIQHSQLYGGSADDHSGNVVETPDKGFLIGGWVQSNDGQVVGYHGGTSDAWAIKVDSIGNFLWGRAIGGTADDNINAVAITATDYIVGGNSLSIDGDFATVSQPTLTGYDIGFVAWLEPANGNIKKMKSFHGDQAGNIKSIVALSNGHLVILGRMIGNGITKHVWVAELDTAGNIIWSKNYGGASTTTEEMPMTITQTKTGGYIVSAQTNGTTGDVYGLHGTEDVWLLNINDTGKIMWAKCFGGSAGQGPYGVSTTDDGGFICAAYTTSNDGQVSGLHGGMDYWAFKTDDTGKIIWSKTFGGTADDFVFAMHGTCDNGVVISGHTQSTDGDITNAKGLYDIFVVRLDSNGNKAWANNYGSTGQDFEGFISTDRENGFVLVGHTGTTDHDVSGTAHGSGDIWFAKLCNDGMQDDCTPSSISTSTLSKQILIYPNPAKDKLIIENSIIGSKVIIYNMLGQELYNTSVNSDQQTIWMNMLPNGTYILHTDHETLHTNTIIVKE